jgi:hypothetical protein
MFSMFSVLAVILVTTGSVFAQSLSDLPLDIRSLLSSLKAAPANDPRFTEFHPPGQDDGMLVVRKHTSKQILTCYMY